MCKALPALRCTPHARERLAAAQDEHRALSAEYDKVKNGRNDSAKDALAGEIDTARKKIIARERDYYASPGGIKELESSIKSATTSPEVRELLSERLRIARFDRSTLSVAGAVHQKAKRSIMSGKEVREKALAEEEVAARGLAEATDRFGPSSPQSTQQASALRGATRKRQRIEEKLRMHGAGIDPVGAHDITASSLRGVNVKKLHKAGIRIHIGLNSREFGRGHKYLPYGGYGEVTDISERDDGAVVLKVEGKAERAANQDQRLVVSRSGS